MLFSYFSLLVAHYLLGKICYNQGLLRLVTLFFEKRKKEKCMIQNNRHNRSNNVQTRLLLHGSAVSL
jgi:hypothetical protein